MCYGCWVEAGSPAIVTEATKTAAELVREVYVHNCVGGNLHIVLDDWNLEDEDLDYCDGQLAGLRRGEIERHQGFDSAEEWAAEEACSAALRKLSLDERASALAIFEGWLG